jgi:hypothetical protein
MPRIFALVALCLIGLAVAWSQRIVPDPAVPASTDNPAARVELVEGEVSIRSRTNVQRKATLGDTVYAGEGVTTGHNGEIHLAMEDGGYLAVRPNTSMSVIAYQAFGRDDDQSVLSLITGSFRSITGWIGRHNPRSYQVRTPTATIGVRGTDHEPMVIPDGSKDGEAGTYDKVNEGGTFLQSNTGRGRIEIGRDRTGFTPLRGGSAPRVLAQTPRFYRSTRNEGRLLRKHEAVQRSIERLRQQRRQFIQERRRAIDERKAGSKRIEEPRSNLKEQPRGGTGDERDNQRKANSQERGEMGIARRRVIESKHEQRTQAGSQRVESMRHKSEEHGRIREAHRGDQDAHDPAHRGHRRD